MKINEVYNIKIEKLVFGGEGIGRINDMVVFVPMSVPGDFLEIKIISTKKTYARGLIQKILIPSEDRINNNKISFEDFSGCDYGMMNYSSQIKYKEEILKELFEKVYQLDKPISVEPSKNIFNYRNKVAEPFIKINGEIFTGFYEKRSHNIFVANDITLRSEISTDLHNKLLFKLNKFKGTKKEFKVYNDITMTGFLKNCVIRNNSNNEIMLIIVVNNKGNINTLKKVLEELYKENENLKSVYISIKDKKDNLIFGETTELLFGEEYISENIFGINFKIYPNSFFQINIEQTKKMYEYAINLLGNYNEKKVIDAFSGTGTIAMIMSKKAKKVIGIEVVKSAVKSAIKTSKENNIKNVIFINDKVENSIKKVLKNEIIDYIIFDPPRKGVDLETLELVSKNNINKIIYISCNPTTLLRDVNRLKENGYELLKLKGFDMFPQTHHIESVALLSLKNTY